MSFFSPRYRLLTRPKPVQWSGVRWTAVDDAKLLIGIYDHGLGNWENIRNDPELGLSNKILPTNKSMKPQGSHLQTRVDYLLKLLQEEAKRKVGRSCNYWDRMFSRLIVNFPDNCSMHVMVKGRHLHNAVMYILTIDLYVGLLYPTLLPSFMFEHLPRGPEFPFDLHHH